MKKGRTLVIGDIHGGLNALIQVLDRADYDPNIDTIIFLGDYTDGWSESAETIEFLINLKKENDRIIFIKGNHDTWVQDWLNRGRVNKIWFVHGGKGTMDSE